MLERFDPRPLFRAHVKALSEDEFDAQTRESHTRPNWIVRAVLIVGDLVLGVLAWQLSWKLAAPTAILTGVALLAGGLIASFGQISTLRLKLTESTTYPRHLAAPRQAALDETVAHLLLAAYLCAIDAVVLVVGLNIAQPGEPLTGPIAVLAIMVSAYVVLLFLISVPRLYVAYVEINDVSDDLSGLHR